MCSNLQNKHSIIRGRGHDDRLWDKAWIRQKNLSQSIKKKLDWGRWGGVS